MGIYINMEMPTSCVFCRFNGAYCYAKGDGDVNSTLPCPLVPVPPHGRLIDADSMCDGLVLNNPVVIYAECMPTIIPADDGAPSTQQTNSRMSTNYCETCLNYIENDPCNECKGTDDNHVCYVPNLSRI